MKDEEEGLGSSSFILPPSSLRSRDHELVAEHEARRVPGPGVDVLDAAQIGLVVDERGVAQTGRQKLHHAQPGNDPVGEVAEQDVSQGDAGAFGARVRYLARPDDLRAVQLQWR